MENRVYTPNSNKYKEQQREAAKKDKKISKVINGSVKVKKKSGVSKFADVFIAEDVGSVKSYVLADVVIPAIKNLILDVITDSANMIFGGSSRRKSNLPASKVSYGSFFNSSRSDRRASDRSIKPRYSYDTVSFETRSDAMEVLTVLEDALDRYGQVTVADFYDAVGITGEYTDHDYGWINLSSADIDRTRDGFVIRLPKALPIDK